MDLTHGRPVVMSRTAYENIPFERGEEMRLAGREVILLTREAEATVLRNYDFADNLMVAHTVEEVLGIASNHAETLCVAGGGQIYRLFLPMATRMYLTEVDVVCEGDCVFPLDRIDPDWDLKWEYIHGERQGEPKYRFCDYASISRA